jgi:putative tryptophan/tyrosine transport system substrate-binding protein
VRRRDFIATLGGAVAGSFAASAQQLAKLPTVGFLGSGTTTAQRLWLAAFLQRLHELGWIEGRNLAIEYRWAEGSTDRAAAFAAEFVQRKVDVIVTYANPMVLAAKRATSLVPIIFAIAADPLGTGLVASLAQPGGNVTGLSVENTDLASKRLELLRELVPSLRRLAIMANPENPASMSELRGVQAAAQVLSIKVATFEIRRADEIASAFKEISGRAEALYVCIDTVLFSNRDRIIALAVGGQLATMLTNREYVEAGGLMSYAADYPDLFRRAGDYVDKILHGAKPGDIYKIG